MNRINVVLIFGGKSTEHEVSVHSAKSIYDSLDKEKYNVIPVGITRAGAWVRGEGVLKALTSGQAVTELADKTSLLPDPNSRGLVSLASDGGAIVLQQAEQVNVVFPVLHGRYGEDGTMQGLLEMANLPYVGCGVLGSALGMDKVKQKELFLFHNIPTPRFFPVMVAAWRKQRSEILDEVQNYFNRKFPLFSKPANTGSSVGISKVKSSADLEHAMDEAFRYDSKILLEEGIENVREVEVSVIGNTEPEASGCGEIVPANEFYDYSAKYEDDRTQIHIPARIADETAQKARQYAKRAFQILECRGMGRVDFFVSKESTPQIWANEINTIPGFTKVSMYPKLWEAAGVTYPQLVDKLINLAIEEWNEKQRLETSF